MAILVARYILRSEKTHQIIITSSISGVGAVRDVNLLLTRQKAAGRSDNNVGCAIVYLVDKLDTLHILLDFVTYSES